MKAAAPMPSHVASEIVVDDTPRANRQADSAPGVRARLAGRLAFHRDRWVVFPWFAFAMALGGAIPPTPPMPGLDPSWITAINVGWATHRRFGHDLLFTYGPWGFLDVPLTTSRGGLVLAAVFAATASAALFWMCLVYLRQLLGPEVAAPAAFLATTLVAANDPGSRLICAALLAAFTEFRRRTTGAGNWRRDATLVATLAALGAFLLQVKFPQGIAVLALAVVLAATVGSIAGMIRSLVLGGAATILVTLIAWRAAHQDVDDLLSWLHGSWQLTAGYSGAMAIEANGRRAGAILYLLVALLVVVTARGIARMARLHPKTVAIGEVLVALIMVEYGFKSGFTRADPGHAPTFFLVIGFVLLAAAWHFPRPTVPIFAGLLSLILAGNGIPGLTLMFRGMSVAHIAASGKSQKVDLEAARLAAQDSYQLPASIRDGLQGHPVTVDPWEATLPWAYSLDWSPVPVFQAYSAFTADLDAINARAISHAPADQRVLRDALQVIDGRNPRWETPQYLLALTCNYQVIHSAGTWTVLHHGGNRCSSPRVLSTRPIDAGETVEVPSVGGNSIVLARFTPRTQNLSRRAVATILKDWWPLMVTADQVRYRLPDGLAGGPLMLSVPGVPAGTATGPFHYQALSFNEPGSIEFSVVEIGPSERVLPSS